MRTSLLVAAPELLSWLFAHYTVLGLRIFYSCTLETFDTVWHALGEAYINATSE